VRVLVVSIAIAIALVATAARADPTPATPTVDPLDEARALESTLDYERALVIVDREIARGAASRARLVELHLLAGKLGAGLDHPDVARAHFARALALAPSTRLPDGSSPKLTDPFEAARAATPPLAITLSATRTRAVAAVGADPAQVFWGLRVRGHEPTRVVTAPGTAIDIPPGLSPAEVDAIDEYGNVLEAAAIETPEPAAGASVTSRAALAPSTPIVRRWTTWALATGAALAVAGVGAARFTAAQDEWNQLETAGGHDYSQLAEIESRGRDWGLVVDIGLGAAAATAIVAIVMYAVGGESPRSLAPAAGNGGIGFAARF
jgi:hypothetical protein